MEILPYANCVTEVLSSLFYSLLAIVLVKLLKYFKIISVNFTNTCKEFSGAVNLAYIDASCLQSRSSREQPFIRPIY